MSQSGRFPRVRVDFQNADADGRVRLNTAGAVADISDQEIDLRTAERLRLVDGELEVDGRVEFSSDERIWVAAVDWQEVMSPAER
jgi:hypothetical protein